jgi:hypothetical protein
MDVCELICHTAPRLKTLHVDLADGSSCMIHDMLSHPRIRRRLLQGLDIEVLFDNAPDLKSAHLRRLNLLDLNSDACSIRRSFSRPEVPREGSNLHNVIHLRPDPGMRLRARVMAQLGQLTNVS